VRLRPRRALMAPTDAQAKPKRETEEQALQRSILQFKEQNDLSNVADKQVELAEWYLKRQHAEKANSSALDAKKLARECGDIDQEAHAIRTLVKVLLHEEKHTAALREAQDNMEKYAKVGNHVAEAIMMLAVADVQIEKGRFKEAYRMAKQSADLLHSYDNQKWKKWEALALEQLASALSALGRGDQAREQFSKALDMFMEVEDKQRQAAILRSIARLHTANAEFEDAVNCAEESQSLCQQCGDVNGEVAARDVIAEAHLTRPDGAKEAVGVAEKALRLSKEIEDPRGEVAVLHTLVSAHLANNDTEEALKTANEAVTVSRDIGDVNLIGSALELVISIYLQNERMQKGLAVAEEELELSRKAENPAREAAALQKIAMVNQAQNQPKEALKKVQEAREIYKKSGDKKGEGTVCGVISEYWLGLEERDEALEAARDAVALRRELQDTVGVVQALQQVTAVYEQKDDQENALESAHEQRVAYQEARYKDEEAATLLELAEYVRAAKGATEGVKLAQQARDLYKEMDEKEGEAGALLVIANLHLSNDKADAAQKAAKEALDFFEQQEDKSGQANAHQVLANVYLGQDKAKDAASAAKQAVELLEGDKKAQASAWQGLAEVRLAVCRRATEQGRTADTDSITGALKAAEASLEMVKELGDKEGEASSLQLVANCCLYNSDGQGCVSASGEAIAICEANGLPQGLANALYTYAQGCLAMEEPEEGVQAAQEAMALFQDLGDEPGFNAASELVETMEESMRKAKKPTNRFAAGTGASGRTPGPPGFNGGLRCTPATGTGQSGEKREDKSRVQRTGAQRSPIFDRQNVGLGTGGK